MSEPTNKTTEESIANAVEDRPGYLSRVWRHEATRRGLAAAGSGVLIAALMEAFFGSRDHS